MRVIESWPNEDDSLTQNSRSNSHTGINVTKLWLTLTENLSRFKFDESSRESTRVAEGSA